ncbi:hypothetical protein CKF48_08610 [Cytobacillus kochii]|uniref:Uncharacterized protein n=1 Tax=Cytobacillus kochii TaxID=859143 RepID=A0A248TGS2_9BACI|nr:hypothetical protein CKF48_08610 [Cytobacillus kochii]
MLVYNYWMSSFIGFILLQCIVGIWLLAKRANKTMRGLVFSILFTFWMLVNAVFFYFFASLSRGVWGSLLFFLIGGLLIYYFLKRRNKELKKLERR